MANTKRARRSGYKTYRILSFLTVVIVLACAGVVTYKLVNKKSNGNNKSNTVPTVTGTLSQPTAHNPTSTNSTPGGVVNNNPNTQTSSLPPASQWSKSANGDITLQEPVNGGTMSSGSIISGLANVSSVQFILVDNSVGLIDQGNLTVTDGKFSGVTEFTSHSSSGKLSVYYSDPTNGKEEDIISIDVNFSS
ncbi:MAG TPA: hypothetical protein VGF75_03055 [Candidatus Saccharimonadales bacterium]